MCIVMRCTTATALCDHAWLVLVPKTSSAAPCASGDGATCVGSMCKQYDHHRINEIGNALTHTEMYYPNDDYQSRLEAWALTEIGLEQ